jgi:hypothetical protein
VCVSDIAKDARLGRRSSTHSRGTETFRDRQIPLEIQLNGLGADVEDVSPRTSGNASHRRHEAKCGIREPLTTTLGKLFLALGEKVEKRGEKLL